MIKKYRKKPVVIEAVQITENNIVKVAIWCKGSASRHPENIFYIQTLEGRMEARVGDWIIKGIKGEFYPCKNDIFEMTYELVEE